MVLLTAWKHSCALVIFCSALGVLAFGQDFQTLTIFHGANGISPFASLVQGVDGNLYGTTQFGGANGDFGTIFKITPGGELTTIYSFCAQMKCLDGADPFGGLLLSSDGNFYGTTWLGGRGYCGDYSIPGCGTIFRITPAGELKTLYRFCIQAKCPDGSNPTGGLIQGIDGSLYGTTYAGGCCNGRGTVFKLGTDGQLTTLHFFDLSDGGYPDAGLTLSNSGRFYGTTSIGGIYGGGTVFSIDAKGGFSMLHSFDGTDGSQVFAGLTQGDDKNFYGATQESLNGGGTIFRITPQGNLTTLDDFVIIGGERPYAAPVQATDGNLYGTTGYGGMNNSCFNNCGIVFELTTRGRLTTLHSFDGNDGYVPTAGLLQATNGRLYGSTVEGGDFICLPRYGCGTVFSVNQGLAPFVAFVRGYGKIGQTSGILGQGFTGTTSVSLNGVSAAFKVVSDTYITATVPPGATSGYVTVTTPSGTLTSNKKFVVLP